VATHFEEALGRSEPPDVGCYEVKRVAAEVTRLSLLPPARDSAPTDVGDYNPVAQAS